MKKTLLLLVPFILFHFSCQKTNEALQMPKSNAATGEAIVVIAPALKAASPGSALHQMFSHTTDPLPRAENGIDPKYLDPLKLNRTLRTASTLIFTFTQDTIAKSEQHMHKILPDKIRNKMKQGTLSFFSVAKNVYATDQRVIFLYGRTNADLRESILKQQEQVLQYLKQWELERIAARLNFNKKNFLPFHAVFSKTQPVSLLDYNIADRQENFIWFRKINFDKDYNLVLIKLDSTCHYNSAEEYRKKRDALLAHKISGNLTPESGMLTEPLIPLTITPKGSDQTMIQGLWKLKNNTMGGPFFGIFITLDKQQYYIEGFGYNPGGNKRNIMWELESIAQHWVKQVK